MNWYKRCAYDDEQKRAFHSTGRKRLKALADALGFAPGSFDLRSNPRRHRRFGRGHAAS